MIRPILAGALLVAVFAASAPAPVGACTITGRRLPADDAERCRDHQRRFRGAVAVAQIEVGAFAMEAAADNPDAEVGVAPVRVVKVLRGTLKRQNYAYPVLWDMGDGAACPYSNLPARGPQIAYFWADRASLDADDLEFESQKDFDRGAGYCALP